MESWRRQEGNESSALPQHASMEEQQAAFGKYEHNVQFSDAWSTEKEITWTKFRNRRKKKVDFLSTKHDKNDNVTLFLEDHVEIYYEFPPKFLP